ncbi:MAG: SMP-30/gluconolactonase/LRE family protein [Pedosphaera sp.]|nr:SMP-30/gluconolactonase/LRE family protein [Pedosphaera sp.]
MSVEIRDERFMAVVGAEVQFEQIAFGFLFTEGPLWHPREHYLLFSDIPGSRIHRWSSKEGVSTFLEISNMSNGLAWDRVGNLLICEHATSRVTRWHPVSPRTRGQEGQDKGRSESMITPMLDRAPQPIATHFKGKQLNSPNDIVCALNGEICFTDPPYGRVEFYGVKREQELSFQGVYLSRDPKEPTLLVDDFDRPNGLCFSLDHRRLFINDTARQHIRVFDVNSIGALSGGKVWAETKGEGPGAPDGMKIDSMGNVYCCGPGGIHVFDSNATCLGVIRVPEYTANFAWGDADFRSLYITASTSVYRIRVKIPGLPSL